MKQGPLSGFRILEVGHMLAGPYCGLLLADLGAEVIKIEPPLGDIARHLGQHRIGPHNSYFSSLNRNKKSIVLDLTSDEGQHTLGQLVSTAQAIITNLRPSAIKKLGLTYESLKIHNERIVCVAITGYGLNGNYADRPAYDYVIQALTGVMTLTGNPDSPPTKAGYSVVDNSAGIMAAVGLLAKIIEGKGGQIDVAMYDVMLSQLNYLASASLNAGEKQQRYANSAHPFIVPAQLFQTKEGWVVLFITHDTFWRKFCEEIGRPEWLVDERFATMSSRRANRDFVIREIEKLLETDTAQHWVERLAPLGVVISTVQSLEDALASDLTAERKMVVDIPCNGGLHLKSIGSPIKFSEYTPVYRPPPLLNEHAGLLSGEQSI